MLDDGHDGGSDELAGPGPEESPETREPYLLEVVEVGQRFEVEAGDQGEDGGDDVVG